MLRRRNTALQTDTPAFQRWFGASKVVDAKGEPRVMYHGTHADFDVFDTSGTRRAQSLGAMFTPSRAYAANYGRKEYGGRVLAVYLRIENPFDAKNKRHEREWEANRLPREGWVQYAQRAGYDGAITMLNEYVVFSPTQIKSATDNTGTFDPDDPSMLRNPRRRNPRAWHGSARALQQFRAPAFFADDRKAARWFAVERAGAEPGALMEVELDIRHPATSADLIRAAKAIGVAVVETPYFEAPEVSRYAPYDGSNPLDLVYIPKVRAELLKRGFDGVRGWDLLEADEIEVWITLRDDQATVVSTHRANPHRRTRR